MRITALTILLKENIIFFLNLGYVCLDISKFLLSLWNKYDIFLQWPACLLNKRPKNNSIRCIFLKAGESLTYQRKHPRGKMKSFALTYHQPTTKGTTHTNLLTTLPSNHCLSLRSAVPDVLKKSHVENYKVTDINIIQKQLLWTVLHIFQCLWYCPRYENIYINN